MMTYNDFFVCLNRVLASSLAQCTPEKKDLDGYFGDNNLSLQIIVLIQVLNILSDVTNNLCLILKASHHNFYYNFSEFPIKSQWLPLYTREKCM